MAGVRPARLTTPHAGSTVGGMETDPTTPTLTTTEAIDALAARGLDATRRRLRTARDALGVGTPAPSRRVGDRFTPAEVDLIEAALRLVDDTVGLVDAAATLKVAVKTVQIHTAKRGFGVETIRGRRFRREEVEELRGVVRPGQGGAPVIHGDYVGWRERYGKGRREAESDHPDDGAPTTS